MLVIWVIDQILVKCDSLQLVCVVFVQDACVIVLIVLVEEVEAFEEMDVVFFLL